MAITAKNPMEVPAPAREPEEGILSDVVDTARSERTQRLIGWLCGLLTIAALVAAWQLL